MVNPRNIKLVPNADELKVKLVKRGDREAELVAKNGSDFVTQGRIDGLPDKFERPYRNIGLIRHWLGKADDWSTTMGMQPLEGTADKARVHEK